MTLAQLTQNENKALAFFKKALLIISGSVFLPHPILAGLMVLTAVFILCTPYLRAKILNCKGSLTAYIFLSISTVIAAFYGNYIGFESTLVFIAMLTVTLVARAVITRNLYEKVFDYLLLSGCISTGVSIIEYLIMSQQIEGYRCRGFFTNPNFLGISQTLVILICGYKAATVTNKVYYYYISAFINALGLYLCGSMSLWVVALLGITLTLILLKRFRLLAIFLLIASAVALILIIIPDSLPRLGEMPHTLYLRERIWRFAITQIKEAPLFGRGFYSYRFLYNAYKDIMDVQKASLAHNLIIDGFLCHGIVGMSLITTAIAKFYLSMFATRRQLKKQKKDRSISGFVIAVAIAVSLYGLIDTTFVWVQGGSMLLLITTGLGIEEREANLMKE